MRERADLCRELVGRHGTADWTYADNMLLEWVTLPWYKRLWYWAVS